MNRVPFIAAALCFAILAGGAAAQCTPSTGSVDLTLNGNVAAGQTLNLTGAPGATTTIALSHTGGAAVPFILAGGNAIACQTLFLAFGGTIDIVGADVLLNGFTPTTVLDLLATTDFSITYGTECSANGASGPALQAVHAEPGVPPFNLAVTGAIQAAYSAPAGIISTTYENWGDDSAVMHSTAPACPGGASTTMLMGTVNYQEAYICSNGPITFGGGTNDFSSTAGELFSGWAAGYPGVSPRWEDMGRPSALNDKLTITEDTVNNTVEFSFTGQEAWGSGAALGDWKCTFGAAGPGSIVIDLSAALPSAENDVVGVSDGGPSGPTGTAGTDSILDLDMAAAAGYTTATGAGPESICEEFGAGTMDTNVYTFVDLTGTFEWTIF